MPESPESRSISLNTVKVGATLTVKKPTLAIHGCTFIVIEGKLTEQYLEGEFSVRPEEPLQSMGNVGKNVLTQSLLNPKIGYLLNGRTPVDLVR